MTKNLGLETERMIDLFELNDVKPLSLNKDKIILHIPHSSKRIPDYSYFTNNSDLIKNEIKLLTDHATDRIFNFTRTDTIIVDFSRIFCDVERLDDENEPMFEFGRGFYYTKTDSGENLREENHINKEKIKNIYYNKHHSKLTYLTDLKLNEFGEVLIIDCHSFPNKPLNSDLMREKNRPDFCIGTDDYHTPDDLTDNLVKNLITKGYSVSINNPYSGTIVSFKHYKKNNNVKSIMIEINRDLYIVDGMVINNKVDQLNDMLNNILFG